MTHGKVPAKFQANARAERNRAMLESQSEVVAKLKYRGYDESDTRESWKKSL